jgi:hypothetical protein
LVGHCIQSQQRNCSRFSRDSSHRSAFNLTRKELGGRVGGRGWTGKNNLWSRGCGWGRGAHKCLWFSHFFILNLASK